MEAILSVDEKNALTTGLALKENRVADLQKLAQLLKKDLFGGFLWTEETKGIGSGEAAEIIDYDVFNAGEIAAFRGVLDDIAKEMGGRVQKTDLTSGGVPLPAAQISVYLPDNGRDNGNKTTT
jgi:hypothetical protein